MGCAGWTMTAAGRSSSAAAEPVEVTVQPSSGRSVKPSESQEFEHARMLWTWVTEASTEHRSCSIVAARSLLHANSSIMQKHEQRSLVSRACSVVRVTLYSLDCFASNIRCGRTSFPAHHHSHRLFSPKAVATAPRCKSSQHTTSQLMHLHALQPSSSAAASAKSCARLAALSASPATTCRCAC